MDSTIKSLSEKLTSYQFLAVYILLFLPVVLSEYGMSDDVSMLVNYQSGREHFWQNTHFAWGRPLLGLYDGILFNIAQSFADFSWIRLIGIIGAALFGTQVYRLYRTEINVPYAWAYALAISLSPAFIIFIAWATCSAHSFSALLALLGGLVLWGEPHSWRKIITAALLLFAAECIYQPTASFFLLPAIFAATFYPKDRKFRRHAITLGVTYVSTIAVYFIYTKLVTLIFFKGTWLAERTSTRLDPFDKITFLIQDTLPTLLKGWGGPFGGPFDTIFLIVGSLFFLLGLGRVILQQDRGIRLSIIIISGVLGTAPLLAASENYTPPRTLPFLYAFYFHFALYGVLWLFQWGKEAKQAFAGWVLAVIFASVASVSALVCFVHPFSVELALVKKYLEENVTEKPTAPLVALMPQWVQSPGARVRSFHEFSSASIWISWSMDTTVTLALRDLGIIERTHVVDVIPVGRDHAYGTGWLQCLDFYEALGQKKVDHPPVSESRSAMNWGHIGKVEVYGHGWIYSPWLGYFQQWGDGPLIHPHLGVVNVGRGEGQLVLDTGKFGLIVTSPEYFPLVKSLESDDSFEIKFYSDGRVMRLPISP